MMDGCETAPLCLAAGAKGTEPVAGDAAEQFATALQMMRQNSHLPGLSHRAPLRLTPHIQSLFSSAKQLPFFPFALMFIIF